MAKLGIDFGTTNTVAVIYDRGIFSAVNHQAATGAGTVIQEVFPSSILIDRRTHQRWFGIEADRRFAQLGPREGLDFVGSLKRELRDYSTGRSLELACGAGEDACDLLELLTGFLRALGDSIRQSQVLDADEPLETVITWPANANGAQRFVTRQAFRQAGFEVLDTLQEPTASAIELADCLTAGRTNLPNRKRQGDGQPSSVAVFDLGGGTFDAAVVHIDNDKFSVLSSTGIEHLGGDDFDEELLDMFLEKLRVNLAEVSPLTRYAMLHQARSQKETISTGAIKSLFINPRDFGLQGRPMSITVEAYEERIRPMLQPAVAKLVEVVAAAGRGHPEVADGPSLLVYLVGGSSKLPFVARMVSEAFPESRVVLTDKPFRSVAMGAAICAMDRVSVRDVFARHFGIIRLRDHGRSETFDTIFPVGTSIPRKGEPPLVKVSEYQPAHNIGHLRYLECSHLGPDGMPSEGVRPWSDVRVPYDPDRPLSAPTDGEEIVPTDDFAGQRVREVYRCDTDGVITVEVQRCGPNDSRCFEIYSE